VIYFVILKDCFIEMLVKSSWEKFDLVDKAGLISESNIIQLQTKIRILKNPLFNTNFL
jgi:hypothetical protein